MISDGVISAFKGIGSPITAGGTVDNQSRYVRSNVTIALSYVAMLARVLGVECDASTMVLDVFK